MALRYSPGEFLNALRPESALRNENMWIGLEEESPPHRRLVVRQISGAIARRIVCDLRPGEVLQRGQKFGMIKLGSRTELILPDVATSCRSDVAVGRRVRAGSDVLARLPVDCGIVVRCAVYTGSPLLTLIHRQCRTQLTMRPIRTIAMFPTMLTLGNLVCGFFAIVVASRIEAAAKPLAPDPIDPTNAAWRAGG